MPNDGLKVSLEADTMPLDAALKQVERPTDSLMSQVGIVFR